MKTFVVLDACDISEWLLVFYELILCDFQYFSKAFLTQQVYLKSVFMHYLDKAYKLCFSLNFPGCCA